MDNGIGQYASGTTYYNMQESTAFTKNAGVAQSTATMTGAATAVSNNVATTTVENAILNTSVSVDKTLEGFINDALKAAGVEVNNRTMTLVKLLLEQQQPVDKNTLMLYNRLIKQYPGVDVSTLVTMHKNNISITPEMINQFENYRANEHQLMRNMGTLAEDIGSVVKNLFAEDSAKAVDLLRGFGEFINSMARTEDGAVGITNPANGAVNSENVAVTTVETMPEATQTVMTALAENITSEASVSMPVELQLPEFEELFSAELESIKQNVEGQPEVQQQQSLTQSSELQQSFNHNIFTKLTDILQKLPEDKVAAFLDKLETGEFKKLVEDTLKEVLLLKPEEVADKEKLEDYYKQLSEACKNMTELSAGLGKTATESSVDKVFNNINDNLSFMQQINQCVTYLQIPMTVLNWKGQGDLYVMRGKKRQHQDNDELTAVLRLNMENLGKMDIFVKLKNKALDVNFDIEKEDSARTIEDSIGILENVLKNRGYIPDIKVSVKQEELDFVKDFLEADNEENFIGKYSFDMKI